MRPRTFWLGCGGLCLAIIIAGSLRGPQPPRRAQGAAGSGNAVLIPAAPTNPYLSLTPEQLITEGRSLLRRSQKAQPPTAGAPPQRAIGEIRDALSEVPKGSKPYREAQRLLAAFARISTLPGNAPTEAQSDPQTKAEVYCLALQNAPEYLASAAGSEYRRQSDELCDTLRRQAVRQVLHH